MNFCFSNRSTASNKCLLSVALVTLLTCFAPAMTVGQEKKQSVEAEAKGAEYSEHMRIQRDHRGRAWSMDTAITRFELTNENGKVVYVDLIGAVHVGEKEYYDALNERFEMYDSMLYELIAPEGTVIPPKGAESVILRTQSLHSK